MKKAIILMLALSAICSMTACGSDNSSSEKEKTTSASAEVVSETDSSSEDSSSTESVAETKKEEPESSKSNSSDEGKDDKGDNEDELSDNFLDIIPLADPNNQVSGNGTITGATIADSLEEGIQAFENLDTYSKVVRVDENSTYDSLKAECDDKSLIAVTFDVTELLDYETEDFYYDFELNGIKYHLELGSANTTRWDIAYTYFAQNDKNTTVIGKPEFKNGKVNILPYAVNIGEMYVPNEDYQTTGYVIAYTPTFANDYSFSELDGSSLYYVIRQGKLFDINWKTE